MCGAGASDNESKCAGGIRRPHVTIEAAAATAVLTSAEER